MDLKEIIIEAFSVGWEVRNDAKSFGSLSMKDKKAKAYANRTINLLKTNIKDIKI